MKVYKTLRIRIEAHMETASYEDDSEDPAADILKNDRVGCVTFPVDEDWIDKDLNPSEKLAFAEKAQSMLRMSHEMMKQRAEGS